MIEKLTPEQEALIPEFREKYFGFATSTEPADRPKAEAAARRLAEIAGVTIEKVLWVNSPQEGKTGYDESWDSLRVSLQDSLRVSLRYSLWDSLRYSLQDSLQDSLLVGLWDNLWDSLQDSLRDSLWDSLWDSLRYSLQDSLRYSLQDGLQDSLWSSLRDSLRDSLWDSLWDSLRYSGWIAFYVFVRNQLVSYAPEADEKLRLYEQLLESCFAFWIVPGTIILCERPEAVKVEDGKLKGLTWRK